jgi:hypothetical protein
VKERKYNHALLAAGLLLTVIVTASLLPNLKKRGRGSYVDYLHTTSTAEAAELNSWTQAVQKIKEDRGEPTGKQAKVDIPQQLRHYSDTRRFLAVQAAEWKQHRFETPKDFVDLAALIKKGEMVELKPVSRNYILFGVGGTADKEPFTRYEKGRRIPLYGEAEFEQQHARMAESRTKLENEIAGLRQELGSINKRDRSERVKLQTQITEAEKSLKSAREDGETIARDYDDAEKRAQLFNDYASLESIAKSYSGRTYDVNDARSRQEMKVRMLSSLRPEALRVLEEVAISYREKFNRPLPITSLVRPDEYQHALSKVNPNAVRVETPPHSTGLAFDIYYRFMTAEEQAYVMAYLARLKDEGRIEVLRENRDHYHVFAFIDGVRPDETFIRESLGRTSTTEAATKETTPVSESAANKAEKKSGRKENVKKEKTAKKEKATKKEKAAKGRRR